MKATMSTANPRDTKCHLGLCMCAFIPQSVFRQQARDEALQASMTTLLLEKPEAQVELEDALFRSRKVEPARDHQLKQKWFTWLLPLKKL